MRPVPEQEIPGILWREWGQWKNALTTSAEKNGVFIEVTIEQGN